MLVLALQLAAWILGFVCYLLKESLDSRKDRGSQFLRWSCRIAVVTGFVVGALITIFAGFNKVQDAAKIDAIAGSDEGRNDFHNGLNSNSAPRVEASFKKLERAVEQLRKYPDLAWRLIVALHDRALGNERIAYGVSTRGCLYFRDGERIDSCWVSEGSKIYVNPPTFKFLRCTDVDQAELWTGTRAYYSQLEHELAAFRGQDVSKQHYAGEFVAAARSAGYFRFCDLVRNHQGDRNLVRDDWTLALQAAHDMPNRKKELDDKLEFLPELLSSNSDTSCQRTCSLDDDGHPIPASMAIEGGDYYEWRFDGNRSLKDVELDNTSRKIRNGISLTACHQLECGGQLQAVLARKVAIREAIATWDISTPPGSSVDIYMTPRIDGKWDSPLLVAHWGSNQAVKTSVNSSSEHARTATDTLVVSPGAEAVRLMLLRYWEPQSPGAWNPTISEVSDGVFDPAYGWGNWSFNVAYVNSASRGNMRAFVTRLLGVDELAKLVTRGVPVVASLRWEKGEMTDPAIERTDGHLLLVRGIDPKGDIVVNDPRDEGKRIRRTYLRSEFRRAWRHSHNTVYIVVPNTSSDKYINILSGMGIRRDWP